jgi:hypothetical protein
MNTYHDATFLEFINIRWGAALLLSVRSSSTLGPVGAH